MAQRPIVQKNLVESFQVGTYSERRPTADLVTRTTDSSFGWFANNSSELAYNPSDLVGKKGLDVYDKMLINSAEVRSAHFLKIRARLSTGYRLFSGEEGNENAENVREFVQWNFDNITGGFREVMFKLLDCTRCGYKVGEKIWAIEKQHIDWRGLVKLKEVKVRNSKDFGFEVNKYGDLVYIVQDPGGLSKKFDPAKFIVVTWGATSDDGIDKYGKSDFEGVYGYYWSNMLIRKLWLLALEKYSRPVVIAKYPKHLDKSEITKINNAIAEIYTRAATSFSDDIVIELLNKSQQGQIDFSMALQYNDNMIRKGLLVGDKLLQGGSKGSYALSKTQFDSFIFVLEDSGRVLEDAVNAQIIKPLVDYNFNTNLYPIFRMPSLMKEDLEARQSLLQILLQNGVINAQEPWVREWVGIPERSSRDTLPGNENIKDWYLKLPEHIRENLVREKKVLVPVSTDDVVARGEATGLPDIGSSGEPLESSDASKHYVAFKDYARFVFDHEIDRLGAKVISSIKDKTYKFSVSDLKEEFKRCFNEAWVLGKVEHGNESSLLIEDINVQDTGKRLGIPFFVQRMNKMKKLNFSSDEIDKQCTISERNAFVLAGTIQEKLKKAIVGRDVFDIEQTIAKIKNENTSDTDSDKMIFLKLIHQAFSLCLV